MAERRVFRNALLSLRQNRLRSVLAGFGIAWGIFILVIFLGVGNGFKNGVMQLFNAYAQKSLFIYGGVTSVPTNSINENSRVFFNKEVLKEIQTRYPCVTACSAEMSLSAASISYDGASTTAGVKGVSEDYFRIRILDIKDGRPLGKADDSKSRNVAVIGEGIRQALFGKETSLGKLINIDGSLYKVVGILASDDLFTMQERNSIYIPQTSYIENFNSVGVISSFCLSLDDNADSSEIEKDLRGFLAYRYGFDAHDDQALYIANIETQTASFESLFSGLEVLIWIVGICLLLSGIVGVGNVMLIIVKERTGEIGIRKAVGAPSGSIVNMIMAESLTITFIAGIIGILLGSAVVLLADKFLMPMLNTEIISSLEIDYAVVVAAFVILCLCGVIAGLFPALKASQIEPVDAIRYENRE